MKKIVMFFLIICPLSILSKSSWQDRRIQKIKATYQLACDALQRCQKEEISEKETVMQFCQYFGKAGKKELLELKKSIQQLQSIIDKTSIAAKKNSKKTNLNFNSYLIECIHLRQDLEDLEQFIVQHAASYYALIVYQDIFQHYESIDSTNIAGQQLIWSLPVLAGVRPEGRWLYLFVKQIDLDLRRLAHLFAQHRMSPELVMQVNHLKGKLMTLKDKIVPTPLYKKQLRKTRVLKAVGVLVVPFVLITLFVIPELLLSSTHIAAWSPVYIISWAVMYPLMCLPVTVKELQESTRYNIPVHSHSLFSWMRPVFLPLTWIPRG